MRRVVNLAAIRWLRSALISLPTPRVSHQSMAERCREELSDEARWYQDRIAKHSKRKD